MIIFILIFIHMYTTLLSTRVSSITIMDRQTNGSIVFPPTVSPIVIIPGLSIDEWNRLEFSRRSDYDISGRMQLMCWILTLTVGQIQELNLLLPRFIHKCAHITAIGRETLLWLHKLRDVFANLTIVLFVSLLTLWSLAMRKFCCSIVRHVSTWAAPQTI